MSRLRKRGRLAALLLALALFAAACSDQEKKEAKASANLCLTLPNEMVLGPYDTKGECATAKENMPNSVCAPCKEKEGK